MNHRMLRMPAGWEWHMLTDGRASSDWRVQPRPDPSPARTESPWPGTVPAGAGQPREAAQPFGTERTRTDSERTMAEGQATAGSHQPEAAGSDKSGATGMEHSGKTGAEPIRPAGSEPSGAAGWESAVLTAAGRSESAGSGQTGTTSPERTGSEGASPAGSPSGPLPQSHLTGLDRLKANAAQAGPEPAAVSPSGSGGQTAGLTGTETDGSFVSPGMTRAAALAAIKRRLPECANWLDDAIERRDTLAVSTETPEAGDTVYGTLPLRMSPDERDVCPFHFWLTQNRLVTMQFDLRFMLRLQRSPWEERLGRAAGAPEAFAVILTAALETLRGGFEAFERRLAGLEAAAERTGRPIPSGTIAELQRELLQWNRHLLAIVEADSAAAESFGKRLTDSEPYRRLQRRLSLIRALVGRHSSAIETLAALSGAAATRKNGTLMRALTAAALLPVPVAAAGALWGMHAGGVPIAGEPWGLAAVCGGAALLSLILYAWLRRLARTAAGGAQEDGVGTRRGRAGGRSAAGPAGALPDGGAGDSGLQAEPVGGADGLPSRSKRMKRR